MLRLWSALCGQPEQAWPSHSFTGDGQVSPGAFTVSVPLSEPPLDFLLKDVPETLLIKLSKDHDKLKGKHEMHLFRPKSLRSLEIESLEDKSPVPGALWRGYLANALPLSAMQRKSHQKGG